MAFGFSEFTLQGLHMIEHLRLQLVAVAHSQHIRRTVHRVLTQLSLGGIGDCLGNDEGMRIVLVQKEDFLGPTNGNERNF